MSKTDLELWQLIIKSDPDDWDEEFAVHRAMESKITSETLTEKHWEIIRFVRAYYKEYGEIPTVYKTCEECNLEFDQLENLFPDGYHRGVIKISGLRCNTPYSDKNGNGKSMLRFASCLLWP